MSDFLNFARSELERAGLFDEDSAYGGMMGPAVMNMIEQFADEGHSGASASIAISIFEKLARFQPITPLTGADDEWAEPYEEGGARQNKRCPHVFKGADGRAYDMDGKIFREPDGTTFASRDSRVYITFPYTPKSEVVDVDADGKPIAKAGDTS